MLNSTKSRLSADKAGTAGKTLIQTLFLFLLVMQICFAQNFDVGKYQDNEPRKIMISSHDPNFKSFPEKSFYNQKADWQYIIDTTWGEGLPLAQKQQIFNTFTTSISNSFDGFESLGFTHTTWDTLKTYYYSKIDSTTSRGRFAAIMDYLCSKMRDGHTYCIDIQVFNTPLNPGVPFFMFGGLIDVKHLGAVTTVLPDSSVLILRVVNNHPLNLEPGDIILGYEGVPWKDLIIELMEAELPNYGWWGGYDGTFTDHLFIGAGMNWHLFDTMDVLKYSSGDTVHLSVAPLTTLNVPSMTNNEQLEIPDIPFPDKYNGQYVSYGTLNNTNIGYIFVYSETGSGNSQFDQAVSSLQNTDALIIDMRWNEGGTTGWSGAFNILANESFPTLEFAYRCSPSELTLCPDGNASLCFVNGSAPNNYDKPIAVLLGPNCISTGDRNAYRLRYLYNVRTFGRPTWASLGASVYPSYSGWEMRVSSADLFHTNNTGYYLNRREFPIDFPVWHNRDDVAIGKDAVVEKALEWINNLVFPHNTITDKGYYSSVVDTVHLSTIIENPNSHQISARAYLKTVEGVLIDSVDLTKQTLKSAGEEWIADLSLPPLEEIYKFAVTVFDATDSDQFNVPNATRLTTAGPVVVDSIYITYNSIFKAYYVKLFLKNEGNTLTIPYSTIQLSSDDPWITSISSSQNLLEILPGSIVSSGNFYVRVDSTFQEEFNFNFLVSIDGWPYWTDSAQVIVTGIDDEIQVPLTFSLEQNYPNPFNPNTIIKYSIPQSSQVILKIFNTLGEEIETLVNEEKPSGTYKITWNAINLPSGVYFYRLQAGGFVQTRKMILLK